MPAYTEAQSVSHRCQPYAKTLLSKVDSYRPKDSALIGQKILRDSLTDKDKKEIELDIDLYPENRGIGNHTTLEYSMIVKAVNKDWEILGPDSPIRSWEQLGRYKVSEGPNADKFFALVYSGWPQETKLAFAKSNLQTRDASTLPAVNVNILPGVWGLIVDDEDVREMSFQCLRPSDHPEIQEYGDDGKVLRTPHSEKTKEGIRVWCRKTGGKISVDDWCLDEDYCNNTAFVEEMKPYIGEVKVKITTVMALFGITMTADQSPDYQYLNREAQNELKKMSQAEMRERCITLWEQWTREGIIITWEASVQQEHVDSWPQLRTSQIMTDFLNLQGSVMYAKTFTQEAAESAYGETEVDGMETCEVAQYLE